MKKVFTLLVLVIFLQNLAFAQKVDSIVVSPENPVKRFDRAVKPGFELRSETFHFIHKKADSLQYDLSEKFIFAYPMLSTWYSTGLYAVPGQPVFVDVPSELYKREIYLIITGCKLF